MIMTDSLVLVGGSAFYSENGFWVAEMMDPQTEMLVCSATGKTKEEAELNVKILAEASKMHKLLDLMMAEINSTPMAVQFFDLRMIKEANEVLYKLSL